ncbi:unnamed protein product [Arctogadus glacialis]
MTFDPRYKLLRSPFFPLFYSTVLGDPSRLDPPPAPDQPAEALGNRRLLSHTVGIKPGFKLSSRRLDPRCVGPNSRPPQSGRPAGLWTAVPPG